jgi:hypothetical protein
VHGELLTLGITLAPSTLWQMLREAGIDPAPDRAATTRAVFRSQAGALLAADFIETVTPTGARMYILAVIEHASRRLRILGVTAHPTAAWVAQAARNLVMDLQDARSNVRYLIRDRDGKYPAMFDTTLPDAGITLARSGIQMPRINAVIQWRVRTCRRELLNPNADLQPTASAVRAPRIRDVLQRAPYAPGHRQCPAAQTTAPTDHRPRPTCPAEHPTARSTRRHPARVRPCRLSCSYALFRQVQGSSMVAARRCGRPGGSAERRLVGDRFGGVDVDAMPPVAGGLAEVWAVGEVDEVDEECPAVCMSPKTLVVPWSVCRVRSGAKVQTW